MATFLGDIYHLCLDPHVKWDINTARDNDEGIWSSHIKSGWENWDRLEKIWLLSSNVLRVVMGRRGIKLIMYCSPEDEAWRNK